MRTQKPLAPPTAGEAPRADKKTVIVGLMLCLGIAALWLGRPAAFRGGAGRVSGLQSCLSNQGKIGLAFAQYMRDFDGKFPRGVDPEDRFNPQTWSRFDNQHFRSAAQSAPLLCDLMLPYLRTREAWRCPDDVGFQRSRLPGLTNSLRDVSPSSFAKYGMSYSYLTLRGFRGMRAADFRDPARNVSLSDADLWHGTRERPSVNALFVDGHAQNLSAAQFGALMDEEW